MNMVVVGLFLNIFLEVGVFCVVECYSGMINLFYYLGVFLMINLMVLVNDFWYVVCDSGIVLVGLFDVVKVVVEFGLNVVLCSSVGLVDLCVNGEMVDSKCNLI